MALHLFLRVKCILCAQNEQIPGWPWEIQLVVLPFVLWFATNSTFVRILPSAHYLNGTICRCLLTKAASSSLGDNTKCTLSCHAIPFMEKVTNVSSALCIHLSCWYKWCSIRTYVFSALDAASFSLNSCSDHSVSAVSARWLSNGNLFFAYRLVA